jgi:peptidoglycan/LPS O-acetylase OafA/YrhL
MESRSRKGSYIAGFDGLRAVAFLFVFCSHKIGGLTWERYGTAGVWLFFVLSGFLITRSLYDARTAVDAGTSSIRNELLAFYIRRAARIAPVYYAFLAAVTLLAISGHFDIGEPRRQLSYWLFVSNVYIERHGWAPELGHLWSLAVEQQFYTFFAVAALIGPARRLHWVCWLTILLAVATQLHFMSTDAPLIRYDANSFLNFGLLAIGGLAALHAERPLPGWMRTDAFIVLLGVGFAALPYVVPSHDDFYLYGRLSGIGLALLLVAVKQTQGGFAVAALSVTPLRQLGVVSYGAYLFHSALHLAPILSRLGYDAAAHPIVVFLLELAVTAVLAGMSWIILEKPTRAIGHRLARRVSDMGRGEGQVSLPHQRDGRPFP